MLSAEQRQDVLDLLRAERADQSFTVEEVVETATSSLVLDAEDAEPPSENEVKWLVKSWEWRTIVAPAPQGRFRFRQRDGIAA